MIRSLPRDFLAVLRDGVRIWWLAPFVPALVVVPEAIQHVAEIRIGMFEGRHRFEALGADPRRMVWGYLKIAGLLMAILAAVRFWAARAQGRRWWDLSGIAWRNLLIALVLLALTAAVGPLVEPMLGKEPTAWLETALTIATLPFLVLLAAGLIGDAAASLAWAYRSGWLAALRIILFAAAAWAPLAWLHGMNHRWAMGGGEPLVWLLMGFDSLVVGLLAVMAGTAIHHGYARPKPEVSERPINVA